MASRMSMLLKDLDLTLNEFETDLNDVTTLPEPSTLVNSQAKEQQQQQADDAADVYDFLDDYGDETEPVSEVPAHAAVEEAAVPNVPVPIVPTIPKVTPTLTQFDPPVSMQHLMRQQNHQQPATQPIPREYAAYQAPPSKFPTHIHVPHPNQQQQQQQQQYMQPHQQQQHQQQYMQMPMPANDDFRRISTATSVNSNGFDDTVSLTSRSAADDEVAALREQLERAKQDLQDQMYMNKVLVSQHQSKPTQHSPLTPISVTASPVTPGPSNESIKDKSDTVSVSSQKSGKSTASSGWFMSRSKSQSKDVKKPPSVNSATTPTTPVEMKKKKSTRKVLQAAGTFDLDML
ncbi:hypothetical protein HDU80_011156 [Chytriomyces hyalinus]|nr:hypothetical protein HDU80_011156 [Chytriomyces hyalinus]